MGSAEVAGGSVVVTITACLLKSDDVGPSTRPPLLRVGGKRPGTGNRKSCP